MDNLATEINDKIIEIKQLNSSNKYYHLKSICNFIYFFDRLKQDDKDKIYSQLEEYLKIIKNEPNIDSETSLDLFNTFISPIGKYYEFNFDFMPNVRLWVITIWMLFFCSIIYLLKVGVIFYMVVCSLFALYYLYVIQKRVSKKVYGFMW